MMKVLVTGGSGLVGRALIAELSRRKVPVNYLTTSANATPIDSAIPFYWNPAAGTIEKKAFSNVDTVIHLAGATIAKRWTSVYKKEIISSRVDSAQLLRTTIAENNFKVKHFISASAIGIYPDSLSEVFTEESKTRSAAFLADVVTQWEQSAFEFSRHGINVSVLRTGLVLSASGGALPQMIQPIKLYAGATFGDGNQFQSWVHISDLVRMYLFIAENSLTGIFNAVAPNPVTNGELTRLIANQLDKPLWLPGIPKVAMKIILGEMHALVYESQNVSCRKLLDHGFSFRFQSAEKALADLL